MHPELLVDHQARLQRSLEREHAALQQRPVLGIPGGPLIAARPLRRLPRRNEYRPAFSPSKLRNKNWTAARLIHDN